MVTTEPWVDDLARGSKHALAAAKSYARSRLNLGLSHKKTGQYEEALKECKEALRVGYLIDKKLRETGDLAGTADSLFVARILHKMGAIFLKFSNQSGTSTNTQNAIIKLTKAYHARKARPHTDLAVTASLLGCAYARSKQFVLADAFLNKALEMEMTGRGGQGEDSAVYRATLLRIKSLRHLREKEEELASQAFECADALLEPDEDGRVVRSLVNLGNAYRSRGDLDSAQKSYEDAVQAQKNCIDESDAMNSIMAKVVVRLGCVYHDRGDFAAARSHFEEALEMQTSLLGPSFARERATTFHDLGVSLYNQGDLDAAALKFAEARKMQSALLAIDATDISLVKDLATTRDNIGIVHHIRGDLNSAREEYEEALKLKRRAYGADARNGDISLTVHTLAMICHNQGDLDAAQSLYEDCVDMVRTEDGAGVMSKELMELLHNLGVMYHTRSKLEDAERMYQEALSIKADFAPSLHSMGVLHHAHGNLDAAKTMYDKALVSHVREMATKGRTYGSDEEMKKGFDLMRHTYSMLCRDMGELDKAQRISEGAEATNQVVEQSAGSFPSSNLTDFAWWSFSRECDLIYC